MAGQYGNLVQMKLNYWTPTNTNTNVPRPIIGDPNANTRDSNRFIENGDYHKIAKCKLVMKFHSKRYQIYSKSKIYL